MSGWEMKIITAEAHRLVALAAQDAGLRADLRALAQEILSTTEAGDPPGEPVPASFPDEPDTAQPPIEAGLPVVAGEAVPHEPGTPDDGGAIRPQEPEPLHQLTLGRRRPTADESLPAERATTRPETGDDLSVLEARCRSKAEAARRAAERQRRIREGYEARIEDAPTDPEMVEWADRLTDSFYWLNAPDTSQPADLSLLDDVGGCFEAVAEASSLVADAGGRRGAVERALPLLAEAQSMLRQALHRLQAPDDPDQLAAYEWVRETAARHRIYLKRFMRADDLADPSRWPDLLARIEALSRERIPRPGSSVGGSSGSAVTWRSSGRATGPTRTGGRSSRPWTSWSARACRPAAGRSGSCCCRSSTPCRTWTTCRRASGWSCGRSTAIWRLARPRPSPASAPEPSAEVTEAARLLGGRSVVLIGGVRRPEAQQALKTSPGAEGTGLGRDEGAPGDQGVRAGHRPPGRGAGPAGDPLVEPCVRGREAVLRPPRQAAGPAAGRLRTQSGRRPDPLAVQRAAWRRMIPDFTASHDAEAAISLSTERLPSMFLPIPHPKLLVLKDSRPVLDQIPDRLTVLGVNTDRCEPGPFGAE